MTKFTERPQVDRRTNAEFRCMYQHSMEAHNPMKTSALKEQRTTNSCACCGGVEFQHNLVSTKIPYPKNASWVVLRGGEGSPLMENEVKWCYICSRSCTSRIAWSFTSHCSGESSVTRWYLVATNLQMPREILALICCGLASVSVAIESPQCDIVIAGGSLASLAAAATSANRTRAIVCFLEIT